MGTLSPRLLEKLACPQCKGKLAYDEAGDHLDCHACKLRYRIADGIPVLLIDEAESMK